jgi:hypothetical protein
MCEVSEEYLAEKKEEAVAKHAAGTGGAVKFVSSNDILVSLTLGQETFQPGVSFIELNPRGRVKADNYTAFVPMLLPDVETPSLVRQIYGDGGER